MQTRSEILAAVLAALCIASPTIEARLKELEPGRGRQAAPSKSKGLQVFLRYLVQSQKNKNRYSVHHNAAMPTALFYCKHVIVSACKHRDVPAINWSNDTI